ncbi:hypothetical protein CONLIGDRAFT_645271 [Coniochaeta ligniaria NRRL 30616]|uniref:AMP-activated protein kinase glycogen-binding domain-containing protein n=1 Tax=Coniochaeta ligniaria NRRL 30616 TaxID=1408157 RepID=A0A1J7ING8_9PEZI|nr:hypothetical protein CONLIGDRAFT_645271 [Coniochaeta ligniaria NRRL 30616]
MGTFTFKWSVAILLEAAQLECSERRKNLEKPGPPRMSRKLEKRSITPAWKIVSGNHWLCRGLLEQRLRRLNCRSGRPLLLTWFTDFCRPHAAEEVYVTGTFDNWSKSEKLEKVGDHFEKTVTLPETGDSIFYKVRFFSSTSHSPDLPSFWCICPGAAATPRETCATTWRCHKGPSAVGHCDSPSYGL